MSEIGVDWYIISCHKLFGPHIGGLCGLRCALKEIFPKQNNNKSSSMKDDAYYQTWESGTLNFEACAGIKGLGIYFSNLASFESNTVLGFEQHYNPNRDNSALPPGEISVQIKNSTQQSMRLLKHHIVQAYNHIRIAEDSCLNFLVPRLAACSNVQMLRDRASYNKLRFIPIVSFVHFKINSKTIVNECHQEGISIREGTFLANDVFLNSLDLCDGIVRISICHYNTLEETQRLVEVLESIDGWW